MVNFNGQLFPKNSSYLNHTNRGLRYGDSLFETIRVLNGNIFFWEDHYLRLMASMRILRMEIPMDFSMEFLEKQIILTIESNNLEESSARVRLSTFRKDGGLYLPTSNEVSYIIEAAPIETPFYSLNKEPYEVELFKDYYITTNMLSNLKTNNRVINVVGSIYANENGYQNCLLLNHNKQVVEALNGNLFLVNGNNIKTPPLIDGCLNGIIRKQLMEIIKKIDIYQLEEASISPFELQKAEELFITNTIVGIQPVTKYKKAIFANTVATYLLGKLNAVASSTSNRNA